MNATVSKYKMGWIGIRVERSGKAARALKAAGFWKMQASDVNNRNGFDWVKPGAMAGALDEMNFSAVSKLGLVGLAVWFCDAQWGQSSAVTDAQWQDRRIIEADFNSKFPKGKR